jgi:hypothetical protein
MRSGHGSGYMQLWHDAAELLAGSVMKRLCYTSYHFCFLSSPYFFDELVVLFRLVLHTVIQNS